MTSTPPRWKISGEYFENCNCDVVCPCLFSPNAPLTSKPTAEIASLMQLAVHAVPSMNPDEEIWAKNAHHFASSVAMAVGNEQSTWTDYGMRWDNAGKNAHYAPINWSNA